MAKPSACETPQVSALVKALRQSAKTSPEGMTRREIAKALGIHENAAGERLRALHDEGRLVAVRGLRTAIDGTQRPVPLYRLLA